MKSIDLEQCRLRPWDLKDADDFVAYVNTPVIWGNQLDAFPRPYTSAHATEWVGRMSQASVPFHLVVEIEGRISGGVGIGVLPGAYRHSAELGCWLAPQYWGRGIMANVLRAMITHSFEHFDLCRIYSLVFATNQRAARIAEKAGMEREGLFRKAITVEGVPKDLIQYAVVR